MSFSEWDFGVSAPTGARRAAFRRSGSRLANRLVTLCLPIALAAWGFGIDTTVAAEESGEVRQATLEQSKRGSGESKSDSPSETAASANGEEKSASLKNMLSGGDDGNIPVFIKSNTLKLDSKQRVFIYDGNVEIKRGDVTITADRVVGQYDDKNRLQTVLCEDNVVVTRGEDLRASSNKAVYRIQSAVVEMTEGPELIREGNALAADKITIYVDEDRSEAEGDVRVKVIKAEQPGKSTSVKERLSGLDDDDDEGEPQSAADGASN